MIDTIIIGDSDNDLAKYATSIDTAACLVTDENFNNIPASVCYTSIADLQVDLIKKAISEANRVIYYPPKIWSSASLKSETEMLLLTCGRTIENFFPLADPHNLLRLISGRVNDAPQIWITGCSIADGFGIPKNSRYGQLISDQLNMPVTFLTTVGTSIPWAADQLLRSELQSGDIVVWGLTSINRFSSYKNKIEIHVLSGIFTDIGVRTRRERSKIETRKSVLDIQEEFERNLNLLTTYDIDKLQEQLLDDDRLLHAIKSIYQVINVCRLMNVKLILFAHKMSTDDFFDILLKYIVATSEYLTISDVVDFADDQMHPGTETNKIWADQILKKLI